MEGKKFGVEGVLSMYASDYCLLPAEGLYDEENLSQIIDIASRCHIYIIGQVPIIDLEGLCQEERELVGTFSFLGRKHRASLPLPDKTDLAQKEGHWFAVNADGDRFQIPLDAFLQSLGNKIGGLDFHVLYVGQAYGKGGSRSAIDRLREHKTLQKIALKGIPEGYRLELLLFGIESGNQVITVFNPLAEDHSTSDERIAAINEKLFNTSEEERLTLYEASLIRHFQPEYNKAFKNSFPSTRMKILNDCYEKDFSAVSAEICFDVLPYRLRSDFVEPNEHVFVMHDLHQAKDRQIFFSRD